MGLWGMHVMKRRVIAIYIDPVLGCNLRCRMCYFSDPEKRKQMHGTMSEADLTNVEKSLFHRALKLQIGCGAEPTLYSGLDELIRRGRASGIPYISLTTNGMLLAPGRISLDSLVAAGLDEITLSMHGTTRDIYENLMQGAKFDSLISLLKIIAEVKRKYPAFKVRVNFTVNSLNKEDIKGTRFFDIWPDGCLPDIVQLRPVQGLGKSDWSDFDPAPLIADYDSTFGNIISQCEAKHITCLAPSLENLTEVATPQNGYEALVENLCYCYVSPESIYKSDFDPTADTYERYHKRKHTARRLFGAIFRSPDSRNSNVSKKLNYKVKK